MDDEVVVDAEGEQPRSAVVRLPRLVILGVVVALFAGIVLGKTLPSLTSRSVAPTRQSLTSIRNDASGDFAAARASGKPVYVLFHSLS